MMPDFQTCFVIRPFAREYQNLWDFVIKDAVIEAGMTPIDAGDPTLVPNIIHQDISRLIWNCDVVVAVLSGLNANVFYELGLAHAAKKPVVMMSDDQTTVPFDLTHIRMIRYDKNNLLEARKNLLSSLQALKNSEEDDIPDFFPELKILGSEDHRRMAYLEERAICVEINVSPRSADVFVNDTHLGQGDQIFRFNHSAMRNTVSASAIGFFEVHRDVSKEELATGRIDLALEPAKGTDNEMLPLVNKRVPQWLRARRKDYNNPVLMRAISSYLLMTREQEDAWAEIEELNRIAPNWWMAINQRGFYFGHQGRHEEALDDYEKVTLLAKHHFIGPFNCACIHALKGRYEKALDHLRLIVEDEDRLSSIRELFVGLRHDPDFQEISKHPKFGDAFKKIERTIFPSTSEKTFREIAANAHYTFW